MTLIALASIKGSPGVTTAATALAASWPVDRQVLLVEADPFGGDLAPRYGTAVTGGLASLFAAARRSLEPETVWDYVHRLPGGLPVLFGLNGVDQAVANEKAWPTIAHALAGLDADVVVDAGRLLPHLAGGIREVLGHADALLVVCEPTLEAIVHLKDALPGLRAVMRGRRLLVVPAGIAGYSAADIEENLHVEVLRAMPTDPHAAAALGNRRTAKRLDKAPLLRWAKATIAHFGIEPGVATGAEPGKEAPPAVDEAPVRGDLRTGAIPTAKEVAEAGPALEVEPNGDPPGSTTDGSSERPSDRSEGELEPVGVGSKREVRR